MYEIGNLNGCDEFKRLCSSLADIAEKPGLPPALLLSADEGCGITTMGRHYANVCAFKFLEDPTNLFYAESELTKGNERFDNVGDSISYVESMIDNTTAHLFLMFDLSAWLGNKLSDTYLDKFFRKLSEKRYIVTAVLRIPYVSEEKYKETLEILTGYFVLVSARVAPPSDEDLTACIVNTLAKSYSFKPDKRMDDAVSELIAEKRSRGRFFYYKTADIIMTDIMFTRELISIGGNNRGIPEACETLAKLYAKAPDTDPGEELAGLIGLSEIKAKISEITADIQFRMMRGEQKKPNLHMMFAGPPGTGKTVVARLVGKIFKEKGILPIGDLIEVTRKDLVGEYIGQTAIKTAEVVKSAIGSVLFIDEAYALTNETIERKDLGFEAVTTLISEMENRCGEFAVIMAGYEDELEHLFELNVGLKDRFAFKVEFKPYSNEELYEIFLYQTRDKYELSDDLTRTAKGFFLGLSQDFVKDKYFANARFVRNIVERTASKAMLRMAESNIVVYNPGAKLRLESVDFNKSVASKDISELMSAKDRKRIGFAAKGEKANG